MKANVNRARAKEEALRRHFAQPGVDSVLVSVDFSRGVDSSVMIVGRKNEKGVVDIYHAFQGEEAESLYYNLLGDKAEEFKKEVEENRCLYYSLEDFKLAMKAWPGSDTPLKVQGPLDKLIPHCNGEAEIVGRPITCSDEEIGKITDADVENNLWFGEITNRTVADDILRGVWATLVMKVDRREDSKKLHEIINKRIEEKKAEKSEGENNVSDPT